MFSSRNALLSPQVLDALLVLHGSHFRPFVNIPGFAPYHCAIQFVS